MEFHWIRNRSHLYHLLVSISIVEDYGRLIDREPAEALRRLPELIGQLSHVADRAEVLRMASLAAREMNDAAKALELSTRALELTYTLDDQTLVTNVELTHAYNLFLTGSGSEALKRVEALDASGNDLLAARIGFQYGTLLARMGFNAKSASALADAAGCAEAADQPALVAMIDKNRGMLAAQANDHRTAQALFARALERFERLGIDYEAAFARHALAVAAAKAGDFPTAFRYFGESSEHIRKLSGGDFESKRDYCEALLSVGLFSRAATVAGDAATSCLESGLVADAAELILLEASSWLSAEKTYEARTRALVAARAFSAQDRPTWQAAAELVALSADIAGHEPVELGALDDLGSRLSAGGMKRQAIEALMTKAQVMVQDMDLAEARRAVADLESLSTFFSPDLRLRHTTLKAALAERAGNSPMALREADNGFRLLESMQRSTGSGELRVGLRRYVQDLGDLAVRLVSREGASQDLFAWFERIAVATSTPLPLRRDTGRSLSRDVSDGDTPASNSLVDRLAAPSPDSEMIDYVSSPAFGVVHPNVSFVLVGLVHGELQLVAARAGDVAVSDTIPMASVHQLLRLLIADQRRWAMARRHANPQRLIKALETLDEQLVPAAMRAVLGDEVVIVPPPALFSLPWTSLPSMQGRAVSVSTSVTAWAMQRRPEELRSRVLIAGPNVVGAEPELRALRRRSDAELTGAAATGPAVLAAFEGADAVHVVAHGLSEHENPLFSALMMADGPLTAYEIAGLSDPAKLVVLSSCEVGSSSSDGETAMLGVVTGLLHAGVSVVVASGLPVPDSPLIAEVFRRFYQCLDQGLSPAEAWSSITMQARSDLEGDLLVALSFFSVYGRG